MPARVTAVRPGICTGSVLPRPPMYRVVDHRRSGVPCHILRKMLTVCSPAVLVSSGCPAGTVPEQEAMPETSAHLYSTEVGTPRTSTSFSSGFETIISGGLRSILKGPNGFTVGAVVRPIADAGGGGFCRFIHLACGDIGRQREGCLRGFPQPRPAVARVALDRHVCALAIRSVANCTVLRVLWCRAATAQTGWGVP